MSRHLPILMLAASVAVTTASCRSSSSTRRAAEAVTARTVAFACDSGRAISVTYIDYDRGSTSFVALHWNGKDYGLAQALSASGARYAGQYGPTESDHGLQWWEAKGEATLGTFTGKELMETRPLLTGCRPQG